MTAKGGGGKDRNKGDKKQRKPKAKNYTERLEIHLSPQQKDHLASLNGGFAFHIRSMINAHMGQYDKEEDELRKRMAVVEPEYLAIKRRLADLEELKRINVQEAMATEDRIEFAHMKLLESVRSHYNRMDLMPESVWAIYSEHCGVPVDELKEWLRGEMEKKGFKV